jgi:hypothetical protein
MRKPYEFRERERGGVIFHEETLGFTRKPYQFRERERKP